MLTGRTPGRLLARGVCRHLYQRGFSCLEEFTPTRGLRVDVMALTARGELWVIECKSSRADFAVDSKWSNYLAYCDRFLFAVGSEFPVDILPEEAGLMIADEYDAEILRKGVVHKLSSARRKKLLIQFGRSSADRVMRLLELAPGERK
ncbi:MAG: MmcB family DNA repair protein [Rhodobacteraceae bacterium]|nr:MmcB family DNA repair protein [Paracoccaceae bacterium]